MRTGLFAFASNVLASQLSKIPTDELLTDMCLTRLRDVACMSALARYTQMHHIKVRCAEEARAVIRKNDLYHPDDEEILVEILCNGIKSGIEYNLEDLFHDWNITLDDWPTNP